MGSVLFWGVVLATQATVAGTVRDAVSDEPVAGALVTLTDLNRAVATDADGRYLLPHVPAGPQHLAVRLIGYNQRTMHALVPRQGRLEINIALQPRPVLLRAVDVRAPPSVAGLEDIDRAANPDRGMSIAAVRHHPLLAEPDVFQALGGGTVQLRPESPSGIHLRGGSSDQTAYLLDGIPVFSPYHAAGSFSAWNPDAVAQVHVSTAAPPPSVPGAVAGAVEAVTLTPGSRLRVQGGVSTTQARVTADGPLGAKGAGYLVSGRIGLASALAPTDEASYLRDETSDWMAKLEAPAFGGRLWLLAYVGDNEIEASAAAQSDQPAPDPARNAFEWRGRSLGAGWSRAFSSAVLRIHGWSAAGDAGARWGVTTASSTSLASSRRDEGVLATVEHRSGPASTLVGLRLESSRTSYHLRPDSGTGFPMAVTARTPVATGFMLHERPLGPSVGLEVGASLTTAGGSVYPGPRARLRWRAWEPLTFSASYARLHQFAQSFRNAESVVGNVFPADLFVGAGSAVVPVARSDLGVLAAEFRPFGGVRFGVQAYARGVDGVVLVAPRDGEPFATGAIVVGSGTARGVALDAAVGTARYGVVASYGWQRVRYAYGDSSYVPEHGAAHVFEAGVIVFPTATLSIRLGGVGAVGRRATAVTGGFEWEACNLLDRGCEFGGSPLATGALGATALPAYFRVDLGVRKHWHIDVAGVDASIALFATVTNVFGRRNVLTYSRDPSTGEIMEIEMRPLAPLVVGLDWRF